MMLATEVAQRRPKCPADYEEIVLSGRACTEMMNGLISKYLEEDKKALKR